MRKTRALKGKQEKAAENLAGINAEKSKDASLLSMTSFHM